MAPMQIYPRYDSLPCPCEVHILKVPEGFAAVEKAFPLNAGGETLEGTLPRAESSFAWFFPLRFAFSLKMRDTLRERGEG